MCFFLSNVYLVSKLKTSSILVYKTSLILVSINCEKIEKYCLQNLKVTSSYWVSKERDKLGIMNELDCSGSGLVWVVGL